MTVDPDNPLGHWRTEELVEARDASLAQARAQVAWAHGKHGNEIVAACRRSARRYDLELIRRAREGIA